MSQESHYEEAKRIIAYALYESCFGEDPLRNWYMACLLIARDDFKTFCQMANELNHYSSSSSSMANAAKSFYATTAQMLYTTSFGLTLPSTNPIVNWHVAEQLRFVLPGILSILEPTQE